VRMNTLRERTKLMQVMNYLQTMPHDGKHGSPEECRLACRLLA
jgi:hypothetical protein